MGNLGEELNIRELDISSVELSEEDRDVEEFEN